MLRPVRPALGLGRRYPLLVVHDGVRLSALFVAEECALQPDRRLEVAPLIVALHRPCNRLKEYAADARHARHITQEVLPLLADRYPLV